MKLYYSPQTRASRPRWLLEELGVPYELERLDMSAGDHKKPAYLAIHPHGSLPALEDGDVRLFESAAICLYLTDRFLEKGLAPKPGTPERGLYYQWMIYAMATLEPLVLKVATHTRFLPEEKRIASEAADGRSRFAEVGGVLSRALEGKEYLVGNRFGAADVPTASILIWSRSLGLLDDFPVLQEYAKRCKERPAYQRATAD